MTVSDHYPQFFTATILWWKHLLEDDRFKSIITDSLSFLVEKKRVSVHGFVIMPNHIHLIWQILKGHTLEKVQQSFLKFTAQQIKFELIKSNSTFLPQFKVNAKDREYQFWERRPLSVDIYSEQIYWQKLNYIHRNPLQENWKLSLTPEEYHYSSARFYKTGINEWDFLTPYSWL